jgi:hypothetical protein
MFDMRAWWLALVLLAGCRHAASIADADRLLREGEARAALEEYDRAAAHAASPAERVLALRGAARANASLGHDDAARERLAHAIDPEIPGASEAALFELAELERNHDRARALNLYYRAAAGAQKNLAGGFPYQVATERIMQLSVNR